MYEKENGKIWHTPGDLIFTLFTLLSSAAAVAGGGQAVAIGQAEASFAKVIAANQVNIAAFLALPCVTDSGKSFVTSLQAGTTTAQLNTESEYKSYMAFVTKPMPGNGKCDGGFQSVASESSRRHNRSLEASQRIFDIENAYHTQAIANLFTPVIIFNNSGGDGCMATASTLYDSLEADTSRVQDGIGQVAQALQFEAARFAAFEAQNNTLRAHCGEASSAGSMVRAGGGQGSGTRAPASAAIQGNSGADPSSITGIQQDEAKQATEGAP